jgi:hypothetical protein
MRSQRPARSRHVRPSDMRGATARCQRVGPKPAPGWRHQHPHHGAADEAGGAVVSRRVAARREARAARPRPFGRRGGGARGRDCSPARGPAPRAPAPAPPAGPRCAAALPPRRRTCLAGRGAEGRAAAGWRGAQVAWSASMRGRKLGQEAQRKAPGRERRGRRSAHCVAWTGGRRSSGPGCGVGPSAAAGAAPRAQPTARPRPRRRRPRPPPHPPAVPAVPAGCRVPWRSHRRWRTARSGSRTERRSRRPVGRARGARAAGVGAAVGGWRLAGVGAAVDSPRAQGCRAEWRGHEAGEFGEGAQCCAWAAARPGGRLLAGAAARAGGEAARSAAQRSGPSA